MAALEWVLHVVASLIEDEVNKIIRSNNYCNRTLICDIVGMDQYLPPVFDSLHDGDWVYWVKRRGRQPGIPRRVATLLKQQAGKCASCGLYIHVEDKLEVDHIIPKSKGGKDGYNNWQLLHAHCHHHKTAEDTDLQRLEVLMATASRMRSRMRLTSQVRF